MGDTMQQRLTQDLTQFLASLPEDDRIKAINEIRMAIHQVSPLSTPRCLTVICHFHAR